MDQRYAKLFLAVAAALAAWGLINTKQQVNRVESKLDVVIKILKVSLKWGLIFGVAGIVGVVIQILL